MVTLNDIFEEVWNAALDANNSPDFKKEHAVPDATAVCPCRDPGCKLDTEAYLAYQNNMRKRFASKIEQWLVGSGLNDLQTFLLQTIHDAQCWRDYLKHIEGLNKNRD